MIQAGTKDPIIIEKPPGIPKWDEVIDWTQPFRELGSDFIASSTWSALGPDDALVLSDESVGSPATNTTVWMTGGTLNNVYIVTNNIVTVGGRDFAQSFIVSIVNNIFLT